MITQDKLFRKKFGKLGVLVALSIPMLAFSAQKTLAIPLEPMLDQMGRRVVEGFFGVGSSAQPLPASPQFINPQQSIGDPGAYQPGYSPPGYSQPEYSQPGYSQPTYQPGYSQPTYPQPTYQPGYSQPVYSAPAYPPAYPTYAPAPNYPPAYPLGYPPYPPVRSAPPVIINNF